MAILAKVDDGSIQLTLTVPFSEIKKGRKKAAEELIKTTVVPGFRKGKAPVEKVADFVGKEKLNQTALNKILPKIFSDAIQEHKITPIVFPRFEIIEANEDKDWQIRAITCELPKFKLGEYKKDIKTAIKKFKLKNKKASKEELEQLAITTLIKSVKLELPKFLIEEEVNAKLASLLDRIEKLGLDLDKYLASVGKTPEVLRKEYAQQANTSMKLDIVLTKIADTEKLTPDKKQVDKMFEASDKNPDQKQSIEAMLRKRKAIDYLTSLA